MIQYSFNAEQRARLRHAITSNAAWDLIRFARGVTAANMSIDIMQEIANELGLNLADYGTPKSFRPYGQPKEKPFGPESTSALYNRFIEIKALIPENVRNKTQAIFNTIIQKQNSTMTVRQHDTLASIITKYEANPMHNEPTPTPAPYIPTNPIPPSYAGNMDAAAALQVLLGSIGKGGMDESRIVELIKQHAPKASAVSIDLRTPAMPPRAFDGVLMHHKTPLLVSALNAGVNIMLVGAAGSGKTSAAEKAADLLGLPFYFTGAIDSAYKLTGFIDAQGRTIRTAFREAYEKGGVFLFDELDASLPSAVLAFNAALANGQMDFPDGTVKRHDNFRAIAACNTFGRGADRQYCGRLQLDAASLDRFAVLSWDYDAALESALLGLPAPHDAPRPYDIIPLDEKSAHVSALQWLEKVRTTRNAIESNKIRHVVSPRASIYGAKLLAAGWTWNDTVESVLFKGLDSDSRAKISA